MAVLLRHDVGEVGAGVGLVHFELWGGVLTPAQAKTSAWAPGKHEVTIEFDVPPETPSPSPATIQVSLPDGGVRVQSPLPGLRLDAYGLHASLPVNRGHAPYVPSTDFARTELKMVDGNPTLHIDGQKVSPIMWASSHGDYRRYHDFSSSGVKIFRPMLPASAVPATGEEDEFRRWWFGEVDRMVNAALAIDPEIRLLPAIWMDPNPEWLFDNPAEQFISGRAQQVIPLLFNHPEKGQVRPTFMSQAWRKAGADNLRALVQHMRRQPYARNMMGLIFFAGRAGENYYGGNELNIFMNDKGQYDCRSRDNWDVGDFSFAARRTFRDFLMRKYGTNQALQQAWQRPDITFDDILEPAKLPREEVVNILTWANKPASAGTLRDPLQPGVGLLPMDYFQCFSEAMIDSFTEWGKAVKEASDNRLLTGCYYGYTLGHLFTAVPGYAGHSAVDRAIRQPYVDIFVSPAEYDDSRRQGGHLWGHDIIDSMRLHNKLFVYEADTRTYLSDIVPKQYSHGETMEVLKRDAAAAMLRGNGWWWLEFSDGQRAARAREWFDDPDILKLAGRLKQVNDFALTLPDRGPSAQIAVFYHGESHTAQDIFSPTLPLNISLGRLTLVNGMQRIGAPYDLYNLADLPELQKSGRLAQYNLCLFLNAFYLRPAELQAAELAKGGGRTLVWLCTPGHAQPGKHLLAENVQKVIGMPGLRLLNQAVVPTTRFTDAGTPVTAGLPAGYELAPRVFDPGDTWERWGNAINPLPYLDPKVPGAKIIAHWVVDGQVRQDLGAFGIAPQTGPQGAWTSVYSAGPYLSVEIMRNIAKMAGVHVYRDSNDILYADKHFVAIHTGAQPAKDTLRLPKRTTVVDTFTGQKLAEGTQTLPLNLPPYTTGLYYIGEKPWAVK